MLRRLSPVAELILINLIAFGPFAVRSIVELAERKTEIVFDDRRALMIIGMEIVCGTLAVLLLIGANLFITAFYYLVRVASGVDPDAVTSFQAQLTWPVLIALTLINPLYDELFVVAYNLEAAKASGAAFAITLSAAVRFVCHIEQGPISAVTILPLGLIFAFVYWRWRLVWPLVVAHGVMDFLGMMPR